MLPIDLQILKYIFFEKPIYTYKIRPQFNWAAYQELTEILHLDNEEPNLELTNLQNIDYTIFDLETTGFIPEIGHEIISIGAVRIHGLEACHIDTFHHIIKPIRPVSKATLKLTGLTREQLADGHSFVESFKHFIEFSKGSILVAHPAKFDMRFLQSMLKRWKLPHYDQAVIDSQTMAQWLFPTKRHQLDPLLKQFHIEKRERHHALNDAMMTSELFFKLLEHSVQNGIQTYGELKNRLENTKKARKSK
ncbi:3'-5' exoribonuclease [Halobacillus shinanisalinarum]|uniref:3'-5' exoribonuclease n=1 Tax=Halobacillus shinanisalinarum TaxID=2932258 RepID=A0ABY4GZR2_9BACI|nr:exonuclease domain-containing protein [Halobacillus shinanisalinarum]UOQ93687.1 3'-5' exoribonuclease [Halobacillus shinanisalinarum]